MAANLVSAADPDAQKLLKNNWDSFDWINCGDQRHVRKRVSAVAKK